MNIDSLTIGEAKELCQMFDGKNTQSTSLHVGVKYLIRTVTMMYTGKIVSITGVDVVLCDAAWIADSGRYSNALETGELNEVEPYPDQVIVSRSAMVDAAVWAHDLPREKK